MPNTKRSLGRAKNSLSCFKRILTNQAHITPSAEKKNQWSRKQDQPNRDQNSKRLLTASQSQAVQTLHPLTISFPWLTVPGPQSLVPSPQHLVVSAHSPEVTYTILNSDLNLGLLGVKPLIEAENILVGSHVWQDKEARMHLRIRKWSWGKVHMASCG